MQEPLMESLGGMITLGKKMKMFNFWFISKKVLHFLSFLVFSNFLEARKQYQEMRQISCECHNISGVSLSCPIAMSRCFVNSVSSQCSNATKVCFLKIAQTLIRRSFVRSNHTHEYKWTNFRIPRQRLDTEKNMQEKVAPTGIGKGYFKCIFI